MTDHEHAGPADGVQKGPADGVPVAPAEPDRPDGATQRRRPGAVLAGTTVLVVIGLVAAFTVFRSGGDEPASGPVHDIVVQQFGGSDDLPLSSFRGKPLVVNFWASWCTFCISEMPEFQAVYADVRGRVEFIGIDIQDSYELARPLAERTGVTYPLAQDPDGSSFEKIGGLQMPTTLFVGPDGAIVERVNGPLSEDAFRAKLSRHFDV